MKRILFSITLLLFLWSSREEARSAHIAQDLAVEIEVVADSSNFLRAHVRVPEGTNARDLMERLFKMDYLDAGRKFVVGVAGFKVPPREKKFWRLEVEGVASPVGIAEIVIKRPARMRWVMTSY